MGKDILAHYEVRRAGIWHQIPPAQLSEQATIFRDYVLFAVLGDGSTGWTLAPIAAGRGIPQDAAPGILARWEEVKDDPGITSPSWVTLDELLAFDWGQMLYSRWEDDPPVRCDEATAPFAQTTLPYLRSLVDDPTGLRLVFWFGC